MTQFTIFDPEVAYSITGDKFINAVIALVRAGVLLQGFERFDSKSAFSSSEWADYLPISARTMQRNQKVEKSFDFLRSEKLIESVLLQNRG